ncbi:MAG: PolC-type DNA polymerase III [Polyangiales bacterium]
MERPMGYRSPRRWREMPIVVWDSETTGIDPMLDRVVEIAFAVFANHEQLKAGVPLSLFVSLVNPDRPIPAGATAVNSITDDMVRREKPFRLVFREAVSHLSYALDDVLGSNGDVLYAAYNAPFDRSMLRAEVLRDWEHLAGVMPRCLDTEVEWVDPLVWARVAMGGASGKGTFKLANAAKTLGVEVDEAHTHRALGDVLTAAMVLARLPELPTADRVLREGSARELLAWQALHALTQDRERAERRVSAFTGGES